MSNILSNRTRVVDAGAMFEKYCHKIVIRFETSIRYQIQNTAPCTYKAAVTAVKLTVLTHLKMWKNAI